MQNAILVTGGAGYIGSHVCKALFQNGYLPVTYDNLSTGHAYAVKWEPFVQADLADAKTLRHTLQMFRPKAVFHFAASALVIESVANPGKYYRNNLNGTITLLEAMRDYKIPHLVFSSTCATYGQPQSIPLTESHPQNPVNPYGKSKLMIEQMIYDFEAVHGIQAAILRYFNVAGADLEKEVGENHTPETHLIPSIIQAVMGIRKEIVVYGSQFSTRDGSAIRDYIHVQDLADAHIKALQWLMEHRRGMQINLGTSEGYTVFEIIDAVQKLCKIPVPIQIAPARTGEPSHLTANSMLAKKILGWEPRLSDLKTMIQSAWDWHHNQVY